MIKVLVIGAGSIGNHLANASRNKGWNVTIYDLDNEALSRTKNQIYPSRYGSWDNQIILTNKFPSENKFNIVFVGTPPDTHIQISMKILAEIQPEILLVEKPFCTPDMKGIKSLKKIHNHSKTRILVGYNHNLTENTKIVEQLIDQDIIGAPYSMHVRWLEHWGGIFDAHPWLNGPKDSYLGFWQRGGGACGEHSHAIAIWSHFCSYMKYGKIKNVNSKMNIYEENGLKYDSTSILSVESENGLVGSIIQDVVTYPPEKYLRIQGTNGFIEWYVNYDSKNDAVIYSGDSKNKYQKILIPKDRPDDFKGEIDHIDLLLKNPKLQSPISFENAIDCMQIISNAYISN